MTSENENQAPEKETLIQKAEGEFKKVEGEISGEIKKVETMTTDELAKSKHPLAPEKPLQSPKQDVVAEEFDAAKPAAEGAEIPPEKTDGSK